MNIIKFLSFPHLTITCLNCNIHEAITWFLWKGLCVHVDMPYKYEISLESVY